METIFGTSKSELSSEVLSLNVRGLRHFEKRNMVFNWIKKHTSEDSIVFLQETHSDKSLESIWKSQWCGEIEYSHGANDANGTLICFREGLEYKILNKHSDKDGRFVIIKCTTQDRVFLLANLYNPKENRSDG